jgi:hypothetical protein
MENTQKIKDSLIILKTLSTELKHISPALDFTAEIKRNILYGEPIDNDRIQKIHTCMLAVTYMMIVKYLSFVDEYKRHFLSSGSNEFENQQIEKVDSECQKKQYFLSVETRFPELKDARDTVLAHGYRVRVKGNQYLRMPGAEINRHFNMLALQNNILVYELLSEVPAAIIEEIENVLGEINENVLSDLDVEEEQD